MENRTGNIILIGMVLGAAIGALGGYYFPHIFIELEFLGTIFLNALQMIVVPLIVASLIVGVASLGDVRRLGRTSAKTILYYLATTGFAVLIGIILVNIIQPGKGIGGIGGEVPDFVKTAAPANFADFIISLVPSNIFAAAAENAVLPLIIFSLLFGGVLTAIGKRGRTVISFFEGLNAAIMKIVIIIIYFAPIGILGIIGGIVAQKRDTLEEVVSGLGLYGLTVIIGLIIHGAIILPLILKFMGKKDPFAYFINMGQALTTAFTTASSSATLPVTMECVTDKNKVNPKAGSFVLPLGATINMDGTALYEAVAAIFIAQAIGFPLSIGAQVIIFLTATLASIGAAAIPQAGLVTMVLVLSAVGLPLEGIGFILAIDWFLDRCRTTVNVWGDAVGAAVIGETAEIKGEYRTAQFARDQRRRDYSEKRRERQTQRPERPVRREEQPAQREERPVQRDERPVQREDRPGQRPDRPPRRDDRRGPKDERRKSPRPERNERWQRPDQRPDTRPDRDRGKPDRKKFSRPDRPDRKKPDLDTGVALPASTVEKELSRVRRHLNELEEKETTERTDTQAESTSKVNLDEETITETKKSGDEFFGELPKFDFFGEKKEVTEKSETSLEYIPFPEEKDSAPEEPVTEEPARDISQPRVESTERPEISEPEKEPQEKEEDEWWGRDKKKRPSR